MRSRRATSLVFLDANVPMYLVGEQHPNRSIAEAVMRRMLAQEVRLATDAEVFQEILHRYVSLGRPDAIQPAFDSLSGFVETVFPIEFGTINAAKSIVLAYPGLSARDAVHVAVMRAHHIREIISFDSGFDILPDIARISS